MRLNFFGTAPGLSQRLRLNASDKPKSPPKVQYICPGKMFLGAITLGPLSDDNVRAVTSYFRLLVSTSVSHES